MRKVITAKTRLFIRHGDVVKILTGRDKGKTGKVLNVNPSKRTVKVEHVAIMKRHTRDNPSKNIKGGILEKEAAIAVSNVKIVCPACGPVRIAHHMETLPGGKQRRTRVCRKCGQTLDRK